LVNSQATPGGPSPGWCSEGSIKSNPWNVKLSAVTERANLFSAHCTGRRQSNALRYLELHAIASVGKVCASRKSKVLTTSLPFWLPFGLIPGAADWVGGTVPAKK